MRACLVVDSLVTGGAERIVVESARALAAAGHDVAVVDLRGVASPLRTALDEIGVDVVVLPARTRHALLDVRRPWSLARELRARHVEVVQTHLSDGNIVGVVAARLARVPAVATLHSTVEHTHRRPRLRRTLETVALRAAREAVAVGDAVANANHRRLGRRPRVIANPTRVVDVSVESCAAVRREIAGAGDGPVVVGVGRLTPLKAWADLIGAMAIVLRSHPTAVLAIAGEGELRRELELLAGHDDVAGHVLLLGERDDVPAVLRACDVFALASRHEGLPLAVLEAMAAGRPVVATGVGDLPAVVGASGAGVIVPPGDVVALAAAIAELLGDPGRRRVMGAAGRRHVEQHHSGSAWASQLLALLEAVAGRSR